MLRSIVLTLAAMPRRAWGYGQRCPHEAIVYGVALLVFALVSKLLVATLGAVVVASGIVAALRSGG
jgi:hypothetical protein